jgi:hypothetical protein
MEQPGIQFELFALKDRMTILRPHDPMIEEERKKERLLAVHPLLQIESRYRIRDDAERE